MLYLSDQFPGAMVCLQDIRHYFISTGFKLFNGASIVPLSEILIFLVHVGHDVVSEWVTQHSSYDLYENIANGSNNMTHQALAVVQAGIDHPRLQDLPPTHIH